MNNSSLLKSTTEPSLETLARVLNECRASLAAYNASPDRFSPSEDLWRQRIELARLIVSLPRKHIQMENVLPLLELHRLLAETSESGPEQSGEALLLAGEYRHHGVAGLLATMILVPAWQLPDASALDLVPAWLWGDYAAWLFAAPEATTVEPKQFSQRWLKHAAALAYWVERNSGSQAVQAATRAYLQVSIPSALFCSPSDLRRQAELRGKILTLTRAKDRIPYDPVLMPRDGRRLRVGFLARHFGPGADLYNALPYFEFLDERHHEVYLLALEAADAPETVYAVERARGIEILPAKWNERYEKIRSAQLDVLVFVGDLSVADHDVTRLALHRLAGLQVAMDPCGRTFGLPEIDLIVPGAGPAVSKTCEAFTERLGWLRGPMPAYSFARHDSISIPALTQEELGMVPGQIAMATVVPATGVSLSTQLAWAEVLHKCPNSRLYIAFLQDENTAGIEKFCRQIDAALAQRSVDSKRVMIFPSWGGAARDILSLFHWADLYLDTGGETNPIWLVEALMAGKPTVSFRSRGILAEPLLTDLFTNARPAGPDDVDLTEYVREAVLLATDSHRRSELASRAKRVTTNSPTFLDALAASDAFGALVTTAYDELASLGRTQFRQINEPLRCFAVDSVSEKVEAGMAALANGDLDSAAFEAGLALRTDPSNEQVKKLQGRVHLAQGEYARAVDYLLAVVQNSSADHETWFALAQALRQNRQTPQALEALEVCMRLAPQEVEPLLMLLDLAEGVGATDMAREVLECLQKVAPDDARVLAMS